MHILETARLNAHFILKLNLNVCRHLHAFFHIQAVGFARRVNERWMYSPSTIDILRDYIEKFPEVFEGLGYHNNRDNFVVSDFSKKYVF